MFGLGVSELLIIFLIILILFGAKKIPELGSGLGEGIKNFTKSFRNPEAEDKKKKAPDGETKERAKTKTNA